MTTIRDYDVTVSNTTARIKVKNKTKTSYAALPTIAEIREALGESATGETVSKIELTNCFSDCEALTTAPAIPSGVTDMSYCFYSCTSLTTAPAIPSGVTSMWACFASCTSLTTAPTIPNSVTNMASCFNGCTALTTSPTIPSSVTDMNSCFAGCISLTTARTIPNGVTDMNSCFIDCRSLTTAPTIPSSVTDLSSCFGSCTSLTTAPTIPNSVTDMSYCFAYCTSLTTAPTIPNSVTDMQSCFGNCTSLTTAPTIPNSVINMGYCFSGCTALTTAPTIPSSVTTMIDCFNSCTSLTTAPVIPSGVTNIAGCFEDCTSLTTAPTIPNGVTNMASCFNGCTALTTSPTIPNSVTNMGYCFSGCTALTGKIVINANPSIYTKCMRDTQQDIVLTGSSAQLQNIANTATNNNVYVWSLSINFSAERQEDDFSKANVSVIINRFRNNNESVSLIFTMDGVEGTPRQVTMDTATKTYTSVFHITPSSIVELSVIAEDNYGKSAPKSITLPIPFYTIDFKAGGMEVAVGAPANDDVSNRPYGLFKCGMDLVVTRLVGEIKMWAGDTVPYGWLLCDGSEVSKTEYPYLYASIGDLWGTPNSSSNFKLPDLTGRVPVGYNAADTDTTETFGQVGATGGARGAWYHTHTIGSSGAHSHASQGRMEGSGTGANIFESYNGASKTRAVNVPRSGTNGNHTHSPGASGSAGNKLAVDKANMPPYAVVKYIICAF